MLPTWLSPRRSKWLPDDFEEMKSTTLADARARFGEACATLDAAENEDDHTAATLTVCETVEAIVGDLALAVPDLEAAWEKAAAVVVPKTKARTHEDHRNAPARGVDEFNAEAEAINRKIRDETSKLAPRKAALERDTAKLRSIRGLVEPNTLMGPGGLPVPAAVAQAEQVRRALLTSKPGPTLEERVAALEGAGR